MECPRALALQCKAACAKKWLGELKAATELTSCAPALGSMHSLQHDHRKSLSLSFQQPQRFFLLAAVEGGLYQLQASYSKTVLKQY
jgi:hypothetical protein